MDVFDLGIAVFIGNALTAWFLWGCYQFHKHDEAAPWYAYGAFLIPLGMALLTLYLTGTPPPHLGALAAQ
jgi:hypothetical protein